MLTIPKILDTPEFYDAKLNFKWNGAIEDRIMTRGNKKIFNLIFQLNHKGIIGLATAMSEMIYWRLYHFGRSSRSILKLHFAC